MAAEDLSERIDGLSPERRELFERLSQGASRRTPTLSWAQERFIVSDAIASGSGFNNVGLLFHLRGQLDEAALRWSLGEILRRHEILRTSYRIEGSKPIASIPDASDLEVASYDVSMLPSEERPSEADRLLRSFGRRPIDLRTGPMMRVALLRYGSDEHLLLLSIHHVATDLWSNAVLLKDLQTQYATGRRGAPAGAAESLPQYRDFATWERGPSNMAHVNGDLRYWRDRLKDIPSEGGLRLDNTRPEWPEHDGRRHYLFIPRTLTERIKQLCRSLSVTPFMFSLAAFAAAARPFSAQGDLIIGTSVANRLWPGSDRMVGFFLNSIPLRLNVDGCDSFRSLLDVTRGVVVDALAHSSAPFDRLVADLRPDRQAGIAPIFQIALTYVNEPLPAAESDGLSITPLVFDLGYARLDLTLSLVESGESITGSFEYDRALFDPTTIALLGDHLERVMSVAVDRLDAPIAELTSSQAMRLPMQQPRNPTPVAAEIPSTHQQRLIWLDQQLHPDVPLYNNTWTFTIHGNVDRLRFNHAFERLVARRDSLRMVIVDQGGPRLAFLGALPAVVDFVDLSGFFPPEQALDAWLESRSRRIFDLGRPLFDSALIRLGSDVHVWYLAVHHIASDAWSVAVLFEELSALYSDELLPEFPRPPQFRDYAGARIGGAGAAEAKEGEAFWRDRMSRWESSRALGHDERHTNRSTQRTTIDLGQSRTERLRMLAAQLDPEAPSNELATLDLLISLTALFVADLSGTTTVTLGVPFSNRGSKDERSTAGPLMSVCPIRVRITSGDTLASLVHQVRREVLTSMRFSQFTVGNPRTRPAYEVSLTYHNASYSAFGSFNVAVEWRHPGWGSDPIAIHVSDFSSRGAWRMDVDFRADLFSSQQRQDAIDKLTLFIDRMLASGAGTAVATKHTPLLSTESPQTQQPTAVEQIRSQAAARPEAIAVVGPDGAGVSYRELFGRVKSIATRLTALGVGVESRVGVCLDRSPDWIVAVLAIHAAGGAFVPMAVDETPDRRDFVMRDSDIKLIVSKAPMIDSLGGRGVSVDCDWDPTGLEMPTRQVPSQALAYVLYTSGSTGRPKAVGVEHGALASYCAAAVTAYGIETKDRVLHFAALTHDGSVEDVFVPLAAGATVVQRDDEMLGATTKFFQACADRRISVLDLPTSFWHQVADGSGDLQLWPELRTVIIGGEKASGEKLSAWRRRGADRIRLINTYGPTETTVIVTLEDLEAADTDPPLGAALPNSHIHLLDEDLAPVPTGQIGEICVGGLALGRGYLSDPAATAERFVPHPMPGHLGERLFRTGDLGRQRADGRLLFAGRRDRQVKVRGYRVEPGEVESVIEAQPNVARAAVLAYTDASETNVLRAFVVPDRAAHLDEGELSSQVAQALPPYMVPSQFVVLDALPLLPSGKVDRSSLTEYRVQAGPAAPSESATTSSSGTEEVVGRIWAELLEVQQIGRHASFFEMGGHSLLVIQLLTRLYEEFGVELSVREFFERPTIADTAEAVIRHQLDVPGRRSQLQRLPRQPIDD